MCSGCNTYHKSYYDYSIKLVRDLDASGRRIYLRFIRVRVSCKHCKSIRVEKLGWLANNTRYTKRFATEIGKCCRDSTNKAVAAKFNLHEHTVKELDKQYMQVLIAKLPKLSPSVIGVDELSIRRGHLYRIIVSDLRLERPIWIGDEGRKEADFQRFFDALGPKKSKKITLGVMDMWVAFRNAVEKNCPKAEILYDKFHIMQHLSKAMDEVRKQEYKRVSKDQRKYIKGQRFILLSHRKNLDRYGKQSLKQLFSVNKRLCKAYILKEQFGQLWSYKREAWARKFFDDWKNQLKWQKLESFVKFAEMVDKHWDGIVSYCKLENKVKLGYVEGANNKIRVIQRMV